MSQDLDRQRLDTIYKNLASEDGLIDANGNWLQAPHCDALVLHAPGCEFCDKYPKRQQARIERRVAFTGEPFDPTKSRCPSEYMRPAELIHRWRGNRPSPSKESQSSDVETVHAEPADANEAENYLAFSQIVSVLANVTATLKQYPSIAPAIAESNLQNGEALVEILRSDNHPPIFFEPGPTETVIIIHNPNIHDLAVQESFNIKEQEKIGKITSILRPKSLEDDFYQENR